MSSGQAEYKLGFASESESAILKRRAEQLARGVREKEREDDGWMALVLGVGAERYGIELPYIWEVGPFRLVTPVPGVPPFVRGVIQYRGEVVPLYDLQTIISGKTNEKVPAGGCVVLGEQRVDFAVAVDQVEPPIMVKASELKASVSRPGDQSYSYVRGFLPSGIVVLNIAAILRDETLIIDDEKDA